MNPPSSRRAVCGLGLIFAFVGAACTADEPAHASASPSVALQAALAVAEADGPVIAASEVEGLEALPGSVTPRIATPEPAWQAYVRTTLPALGSGESQLLLANKEAMSLGVSLVGALAAKAIFERGYVLYENILPGATAIHRVSRWSDEDYVYFASKPAEESLTYAVRLGTGVSSLRLVGRSVEFLSEDGMPGLRMSAPYAVSAAGTRVYPKVFVEGCNYSEDPNPQAKAEDRAPGAPSCLVHLRWSEPASSYPLLVDPEWGSSSQLPAGFLRGSPQIHKLSTGSVLATGNSTNASQLWNPATGVWSATGTSVVVADANSAKSVTLNDGAVLMFSGVSGGVALSAAQRFDPATGLWSARASLPVALHRPTGITLSNGRVLVAGGANGNLTTVYNASYLWDPTGNTWASTGSMAGIRRDATLITLDANRVMVAGGTTNGACSGALSTAEIYNVASGTWSAAANLPFSVVNPNLLMLSNGKVLAAASVCNTAPTGLYTVGTNSWAGGSNVSNAMSNMSGQGLAELSGIVYGPSAASAFPNQYNVATSGWGTGLQAPQALSDSALVSLPSGSILAVAGNGSNATQILSVCGDGVKNTGETCDDGNSVGGDGCSAACAVEATFQCQRPNLVANGDFEFPLAPSGGFNAYTAGATLSAPGGAWTVGGGGAYLLDNYVSTPLGAQVIDLAGPSGGGSVSQNIGTIVGHNYVWYARMAQRGANSGTVVVTSGASVFTWNVVAATSASSSPWDLYKGSFTAGATTTSLAFNEAGSPPPGFGIIIDDVQVYDLATLGCVKTCGNGVFDGTEACDDGNTASGDGCSSSCTLEANFSCSKPSVLFNGETELPARPGNGCATYAGGNTTVSGWTVFGQDIQHCYNNGWAAPSYHNYIELNSSSQGGIVSQNYGTIAGHIYAWEARVASHAGCGPGTKTGYVAVQSGNQSYTTPFSSNIDATLTGSVVQWGRVSGRFVAASTTGAFSAYSTTQGNCGPTIDAMRVYDLSAGTCFAKCGNGVIEAGETCDDGNASNGDGCSSACAIEAGQSCPSNGNLVTNGGFETPVVAVGGLQNVSAGSSVITGWTINSGDTEVSNAPSGNVAPQGSNYIDTAGTFNVRMTQSIAVTPGASYVWSVRAASNGGSSSTGRGLFSLSTSASDNISTFVNTTANANTAAWDTVSGRWTPAAGTTTIELQGLSSGNTAVYYDDVRLQKIQSCMCDGNYGTGTPNACSVANPICFATGLCGSDAHPGCS